MEYVENNFTADYLKVYARADPNVGDVGQREHPELGWIRGGVMSKKMQYLWNGTRQDQGYMTN